jgi:hypothetical protein
MHLDSQINGTSVMIGSAGGRTIDSADLGRVAFFFFFALRGERGNAERDSSKCGRTGTSGGNEAGGKGEEEAGIPVRIEGGVSVVK